MLERSREPAEETAPERAVANVAAVTLPERVLALQRTAGNAAVAQLLARFERDTPKPSPPEAGTPEGGSPDAGVDEATAPDNPSIEQDAGTSIGVCGPDVTKQLAATLGKIETDFDSWSSTDKRRACYRILNPIDVEEARKHGIAAGDYNGWDTYALFSAYAGWLRRPPVCGPCAMPSSSAPTAPWKDKGHEDPRTCSNTVQVGNACWLAGTVNYATYGMMVRLCGQAFSGDTDMGGEHGALEHAKTLIKGYKTFKSKENPKWPLEWTEEVYRGGPKATVGGGNRAGCATTCTNINPKANPGALASWDYVWEPVKGRVSNPPILTPAPAPAPSH